jgi:hypothetical protein
MRKLMGILTIACFFTLPFQAALNQKEAKTEELPKVGEIYKYQGVEWYVRGVGDKPFEYTATGESLGVVTIGVSGAIVLIPKKGQVVRIDPTEPMIYVDKIPDKELSRNSYFKEHAKDKVFLLLELKRT